MGATASDISVTVYQYASHHIPEDLHLYRQLYEILKCGKWYRLCGYTPPVCLLSYICRPRNMCNRNPNKNVFLDVTPFPSTHAQIFKGNKVLRFSGCKKCDVTYCGDGTFLWLSDISGPSHPFCPLTTAFPAWFTSILMKDAAHYSETSLRICLPLHGVTYKETVMLLSFVTEVLFFTIADKSTSISILLYK
jgi:hypothetical protein